MEAIHLWFNKVLSFLHLDPAEILWKALKIIIVLVVAWIGKKIGYWFINRAVKTSIRAPVVEEKRAFTLRTVLRSVVRYTIYFLAFYQIASIITPRTGAILAGAGIAGLALGFGAQRLVQDMISGFFILMENQFAAGEYVKIGTFEGVVEEIGLRTTKIRQLGGEIHLIPNGQIKEVTNYSRGNVRATVDIGVAPQERVERVLVALEKAVEEVKRDMAEVIIEGPQVLGVVNLTPTEMTLRIIARTKPLEQWAVEREIRRRVKRAFEEAGIGGGVGEKAEA